MKTTCIINNYNYDSYVVDAVNSALKQSVPFDEIVVIDDGSTDSSPQILKDQFGNNPKIKIILSQQNLGQLSGFNQGYLASNGKIIFFLDSDDAYQENYLEEALKIYASDENCSFLTCEVERTNNFKQCFVNKISNDHKQIYNLGYSVVSVIYASNARTRVSTSGISIKKEILDKFMPIPLTEDWRISADQCLNFGASFAGAKKYYLANPFLVKYRVHGHNNWFNQPRFQSHENTYLRSLKKSRLFNYMIGQMHYDKELLELAASEFKTIPKPTFNQLRLYLRLVLMKNEVNLYKKFKMTSSMIKYYYAQPKFSTN